MNHTPGPWTVSISDDARIEDRITTEDGAPVFVGRFVNYDNARLIAASPEILKSLMDVVAASDANCGDSLANAINAARAAIAKAIGE